ncbi:MAG TPA: hypothetical protein VNX21_02815 [Candidatus Thermoplasmatota archaeon]|nr:hypothetical protein [Candidatus Thermoplasmatota archaeon]
MKTFLALSLALATLSLSPALAVEEPCIGKETTGDSYHCTGWDMKHKCIGQYGDHPYYDPTCIGVCYGGATGGSEYRAYAVCTGPYADVVSASLAA